MTGLAKRLILWIITFVLLFVLGIILCKNSNVVKEPESHAGTLKDVAAITSYIKKLNETYPTDIMVFGTKVEFENELTVRQIDEITEESLTSEKPFHFLIVNDIEEEAPLKEEEITRILDDVYKKGYNLYYIGSRYEEQLHEAAKEEGQFNVEGALEAEQGKRTNDKAKQTSFILIHSKDGIVLLRGVWGEEKEECYKENREILGDILLRSMSHVVEGIEDSREE